MMCDCDDIIGMPVSRNARRVLSTCSRWAIRSVTNLFRCTTLRVAAAALPAAARFGLLEQRFEMIEIVVPEDPFFGATSRDPGDHRGVVFLVRQDEAMRQ
jgi:hypothetical protein